MSALSRASCCRIGCVTAHCPRPGVPIVSRRFSSLALAPQLTVDVSFRRLDLVAWAWRRTWEKATALPRRRPFATNLVLSFGAAGAGDYLAQRAEGATRIDKRRSLLLCSFGLWTGFLHWHLYINVFGKLFPRALPFANKSWAEKLADNMGQRELVRQVALDTAVWMPLFYFPMFYAFKELLQGDYVDMKRLRDLPEAAMQKYRATWLEDNAACCAVWIPGDFLCFMVPVWLRMPTGVMLNFIWNSVLSLTRGGGRPTEQMS